MCSDGGPEAATVQPLEPVLIVERFPPLLDVLGDLDSEQWEQPTALPGWSVKDVALHLLGGDIGILSRQRDGYTAAERSIAGWDELVAFVNERNAAWVAASGRISPRLLCDLLRFTGEQVSAFFASRDPFALGPPVSWAGPAPAPIWLDLACEYTERWHHQQQIRDAVGRPGLMEPFFLAPVLDTFVRALPWTFRTVTADSGTRVALTLSGAVGGRWLLERQGSRWELFRADDETAAAEVVLPVERAWRLFTRGISPQDVVGQATVIGSPELAQPLFETIAVIA